jgi:hypothetical protein
MVTDSTLTTITHARFAMTHPPWSSLDVGGRPPPRRRMEYHLAADDLTAMTTP